MAKLKTPLLGLSAHGTLGNALTFQSSNTRKFVRSKPTPTNPQSLAQTYHRWLYQDYCASWHSLSAAQKQQWESDARPYHITGFNLWLRTWLPETPDILLSLHLDQTAGGTAFDSSSYLNTGTIFGALPVPGLIHQALLFDGLDDYISIPQDPSLTPDTALTIEFFLRLTQISRNNPIFRGINYHVRIYNDENFNFAVVDTSNNTYNLWSGAGALTLQPDTDYHIACTYDAPNLHLYFNGDLVKTQNIGTFDLRQSLQPLRVASDFYAGGWQYLAGLLDELRLSDRALTASDSLRHSQRRYP